MSTENKPLNKPIREVKGNKKFKVFVKLFCAMAHIPLK